MKKTTFLKLGLAAMILLAVGVLLLYCGIYSIRPDPASLSEGIGEAYLSSHTSVLNAPPVQILRSIEIDRNIYVLMEIGEEQQLGTVSLKKGLNGRCKLTHLSYGDGNFEDGIIEADHKNYLLFGGRDPAGQIDRIVIELHGEYFEFTDVCNSQGHFLCTAQLHRPVEEHHINRDDITFYDKDNHDITSSYDLSGGGFQ